LSVKVKKNPRRALLILDVTPKVPCSAMSPKSENVAVAMTDNRARYFIILSRQHLIAARTLPVARVL